MANIQQSLNQMLMSAQVGAGFYAHTPMGQRMGQLKELSRKEEKINKQIKVEGQEEFIGSEWPTVAKNYGRQLGELTDIAKQRYELDPTEKAFQSLLSRQKELGEWEEIIKQGGGED